MARLPRLGQEYLCSADGRTWMTIICDRPMRQAVMPHRYAARMDFARDFALRRTGQILRHAPGGQNGDRQHTGNTRRQANLRMIRGSHAITAARLRWQGSHGAVALRA